MVDFILFAFFVGVFFVGFWCGGRFGTLKSMVRAATVQVKSFLGD